MSPRKKTNNPELDDYPNLRVRSWGVYYIVHPKTKREKSLSTKDATKAKQIYALVMDSWKAEIAERAADVLIEKLGGLGEKKPRVKIDMPTVADYAKKYRTEWLAVDVIPQGGRNRYEYGQCRALTKKGKILSKSMVRDYAGFIFNQIEPSEELKNTLIDDKDIIALLRRFLSRWGKAPATYNHMLATLSRIFSQAVTDGLRNSNPIESIPSAIIPEKTDEQIEAQYISDADYAAITQAMMIDEYEGRRRDGEWIARLVDLMLFMSSRPADAFKVEESNFDESGNLIYKTNKTRTSIWVEDTTGELAATVLWFREWKRKNNIISKYLCVQPSWKRKGVAGTAITVKFVSSKFSEAVERAGYPKGRWTLRLIRHKGITEEALKNSGNNKGGHLTESARKKYQTKVIPVRVQNTLINPRNAVAEIKKVSD